MKKAILLIFVMMIGAVSFSQNTDYDTISATYADSIAVTHSFRYLGDTSSCPGELNVPVPNNSIVISVDVSYDMTSVSPQKMYQQRSQLWCTSPGGSNEPAIYNGSGYTTGTYSYSRTGLDIAKGIKPIFGLGVDFELHAGTINYSAPDTCNGDVTKVDAGTWTVSVVYLPPGSPGFPSDPTPVPGTQLVSLSPTLSWTFGSNTNTYDLYLGTDTATWVKVVDNATASGSTGSYTASNLDPSAEYFWKVVCKNSTNENPGELWSFFTKCPEPAYPYYEGFDNETSPDLPPCWVDLSPSTNPSTEIISYPSSSALSAPNYVRFNADAEPTPELILVLPEVSNVSNLWLSMYGKNDVNWNNGQPYTFPFEIGTMSDPFDESTFVVYDSYIPGKDWTLREVYFNNYTGSDTYIAIRAAVPQYARLYLDDVTLDEIPGCVKPLYLTEESVTTGTTTISWTDLISSPGMWQLEYDTTGFNLGTGTQVIVNSNPATITGLLDGTYYDIYARSICSPGDTSDWSWPVTILTDCLPKDVPLFEDFGDKPPYPQVATIPLCWSQIEIAASNNGGIFYTSSASYTGSYGIGVAMTPDGDQNAQLILTSPEMTVPVGDLQVSFYAKRGSSLEEDSLLIVGTMTDPTDYTTFHPYDTISGLSYQDWNYYTVYFINYTGTDNYIAWKYDSEQHPDRKIYFDEILIEEMASCIIPINVDIASATSSSATIDWEDINGATDWEIIVGDTGFVADPANALFTYSYNNPSSTGSESFVMTGLSSGTLYDSYIRTSCGGGDYSYWNGPFRFRTSFALTSLPVFEDFENGEGLGVNGENNTVNWALDTTLYVSTNHSMHNAYTAANDNILYFGTAVDLTSKTNAYLSFYQIAKTDGTYDHCYVEISTDGGSSWDQLPVSTYKGHGKYREEGVYNYPEGPSFDEDSYPEWGTGYQIPDNTWWKKEYFDLRDYNMYDNVSFRFRLVTNNYTNKKGWYLDDIRIEEMTDPNFAVSPMSVEEYVPVGNAANVDMTMTNTGNFPVYYNASVVYNETLLIDENFDTGIPASWTTVANGTSDTTWRMNPAYQTYYTFDGTPFAFCNGQKGTSNTDLIVDADLISPVIDASAYIGKHLVLEFDQAYFDYYKDVDTARIYVYDGTDWVMIYEKYGETDGKLSYNANGVHKAFDVSQYANANFQVKYNYYVGAGFSAYYYAIDNVKLRASDQPIGWLTVDGAEVSSGIKYPDSDNVPSVVDIQLDASNLTEGTYTADVEVTSDDPANPSYTIPVTIHVVAGFDVKAMLEGPYNGSTMNTDLNNNGVMPLSQSYGGAPWNYNGTETVAEIPAGAVDWVLVQARDAADANSADTTTVVETIAAFIMDDGTIAGVKGGRFGFNNLNITQNLFLVVYHRNHLGIISANALTKTDGVYSYDFTTGSGQALGDTDGQKEISTGVWGMIAADGNADGIISSQDKNTVWTPQAGQSGYMPGDYNLDGQVNNQDKNDLLLGNETMSSQIPQ